LEVIELGETDPCPQVLLEGEFGKAALIAIVSVA